MKRYSKHSKRSGERAGFYVALSICMLAVGLAVWSAYTNVSEYMNTAGTEHYASLFTEATAAPAAQEMTGVTESETPATSAPAATDAATDATERSTKPIYESATIPPRAEDVDREQDMSALSAVLKVNDNLVYPVKSRSVLKQYSEDAVYSKTMGDYRAHTGCDFAAEVGEPVYAMCGGTVKNISVSELYGVIVEVDSGEFSVCYCGLSTDFAVDKGDELKAGDTVGTVSEIPCESKDDPHVHIEIRSGGRLIDPLSVINNND